MYKKISWNSSYIGGRIRKKLLRKWKNWSLEKVMMKKQMSKKVKLLFKIVLSCSKSHKFWQKIMLGFALNAKTSF